MTERPIELACGLNIPAAIPYGVEPFLTVGTSDLSSKGR